jgi:anti-sigma B factor antagonist
MSAKINIHHTEDVTVLEVSGQLVLGEAGVTFHNSVQNALESATKKLIVDMGGVDYMDSSGLAEFIHAHTSAKSRGCVVKLARLTRKLDSLMQITRLSTVFDIYPDEVEAVAAFSHPQPAAGETAF